MIIDNESIESSILNLISQKITYRKVQSVLDYRLFELEKHFGKLEGYKTYILNSKTLFKFYGSFPKVSVLIRSLS